MPAAHRHTDTCTGHGCFPSRANVQGSPNVLVNNLGSHRVGDAWASHCCVVCHDSTQASGSPNVFVNGVPHARVGDSVACGSSNATGSTNVFINGG